MISLAKYLNWRSRAAVAEEPPEVPPLGGNPAEPVPLVLPANPSDLWNASLQALQMLLEGLPFSSGARGESGASPPLIAELRRRLGEPLAPLDVIEIASDALTALEQDAQAAHDRESREQEVQPVGGQQTDLSQALLQALQMILESVSPQDDSGGSKAVAIAELQRRLAGPLVPFDVLEIASDAVVALEQPAPPDPRLEERQEELRQSADQQTRNSQELQQALHALLEGLPLQSDTGARAIAGLLRRLEHPLQPLDAIAIANDALAALEQDGNAALDRLRQKEEMRQISDQQDDLSQSLLRAMDMLLEGFPLQSDAGARAFAELRRRLERPLLPPDAVAIASEAVAVVAQDAKTVQERQQQQEETKQVSGKQANLSQALLEAFNMLVRGLPLQNEKGAQTIAELTRRLERPLVPFDVLEIASDVVTAVELETKITADRFRDQNLEFQSMISMLTDTVAGLSVQKTNSVSRLQRIERQIEQTSLIEDIRSLKGNLAECLHAVREEFANQQKQSAETIQLFEQKIQTTTARLAAAPLRPAPVDAYQPEPIVESKPADYAVVFLLDRESSLSRRFGEDARHKVLAFVHQHIRASLMPSDRVIRWKGSAFLASLKRVGSIQDVRAELSSAANFSTVPSIEVGSRSIHVPVSLSWAVFAQARFASLDLLFEKVDEFIARAQGSKTN